MARKWIRRNTTELLEVWTIPRCEIIILSETQRRKRGREEEKMVEERRRKGVSG